MPDMMDWGPVLVLGDWRMKSESREMEEEAVSHRVVSGGEMETGGGAGTISTGKDDFATDGYSEANRLSMCR